MIAVKMGQRMVLHEKASAPAQVLNPEVADPALAPVPLQLAEL